VDIHALTTVETTEDLKQNTMEMALDGGNRHSPSGVDPFHSIACAAGHGAAYPALHGHSAR
jgi:hypothetical protein